MKLTRYLLAVALAALTTGAHAQAISALTGASALSGSEVTAVVQSATTKKATVDQFRTYILGGNTWTAGTGTLTLGAGKTATISNTLTFTGTDGSTLNVGTGGTLGTAAYTASSAYEAAGVALLKASNLSDLTSASTARTNLGLGTLATQSGTFSGTSSGTNTGDQTTVSGNAGTATALQTARAIYGNNFDGTAALTQIIASTYGGTGNGFTKFTGPTTAERTFTLPDSSATLLYSGGAAGTPSSITLTNGTALPSAGITMSTARLLGRTTALSGAAEEITVGSGLSLSAGTLTATGGSVAIGDVTGLGTNVATALGVAVGSDGAFVTRGGNAGTPSALVCTNCTGTAASLTAGTVTTNANLTGDVTSSGNATTLATVNSNVGSFTNANITVNAKGLITAAANGSGGSGTVTATGGSLTSNAVVLGADTTDTKVVAGITSDGTSALNLGVAGASVGKVVFANATSGTGTLQPPTGALGTITYTLPGVTSTLSTLGANTYTGTQTLLGSTTTAAASLASAGMVLHSTGGGSFVQFGVNSALIGTARGTGLAGFEVSNVGGFSWSSNGTVTTNADTGLARNAAGIVEVNNGNNPGTASNIRDMRVRHYLSGGTAPTVAGNGSSNGSIAGGDSSSQVTVGTGTTTSIVITFGTAFTNAPACVVNAQTTTTPINVVTATTTATLTTAAFTAGEVLHVVCLGF